MNILVSCPELSEDVLSIWRDEKTHSWIFLDCNELLCVEVLRDDYTICICTEKGLTTLSPYIKKVESFICTIFLSSTTKNIANIQSNLLFIEQIQQDIQVFCKSILETVHAISYMLSQNNIINIDIYDLKELAQIVKPAALGTAQYCSSNDIPLIIQSALEDASRYKIDSTSIKNIVFRISTGNNEDIQIFSDAIADIFPQDSNIMFALAEKDKYKFSIVYFQ